MNTLVWKLKGNMTRKAAKLQEMRKQRGVTLLEIIIVLGIIGVIAAGVVILAQRAFTAQDLSDIQNNANSIRTSMVEAFKDEGSYPESATIVGMTKSNIATNTATPAAPIVTLVKLGKISAAESFNGMSNDAFQIGNAKIDTSSTEMKGFVVLVNGLETEECRNLISEMGNQWDYVESVTGATAGADLASLDGKDLSVAKASPILKTMVSGEIAAAEITDATVCAGAGATNGVIFGSK